MTDSILQGLDSALRTLFAPALARRPCPQPQTPAADKGADVGREPQEWDASARRHAAGLMRVNHTGEICAQALYTAQALVTKNPDLRRHFLHAAQEETDHLAWTQQRLEELESRPSWLNPLWYTGAFAIGLVAGKLGGDGVSLGFVVETEKQVEAHLDSHLQALPQEDLASRAIVAQMMQDEAQHALQAQEAGASGLPLPVRMAMRSAAKVMTTLAYRI